MVGAPISYSGCQPYPPPPTRPSTQNPQAQAYATHGAPLSTLLPYDGRGPPGSTPFPGQPPASTDILNTSYLFPPNIPPPSTSLPPPFPPCSTTVQANPANTSSAYPPAPLLFPATSGYPPNQVPPPHSAQPPAVYPPVGYPSLGNNSQPPLGYPTGQKTGNYTMPPPTTSWAYPPSRYY